MTWATTEYSRAGDSLTARIETHRLAEREYQALPLWVASGTYSGSGVVQSLARPGGNMTGVRVEEPEIWGKRLQILKEAIPSASKIAYLDIRTFWESASGRQVREELRKASQILEISLNDMLVEESTASEYQRVFHEIARTRRMRSSQAVRVSFLCTGS